MRKLQERMDKSRQSYDYEKQVWILDGIYQPCAHPESLECQCYGRLHAYETATITEHCR